MCNTFLLSIFRTDDSKWSCMLNDHYIRNTCIFMQFQNQQIRSCRIYIQVYIYSYQTSESSSRNALLLRKVRRRMTRPFPAERKDKIDSNSRSLQLFWEEQHLRTNKMYILLKKTIRRPHCLDGFCLELNEVQ